jgi:hypothetical protein
MKRRMLAAVAVGLLLAAVAPGRAAHAPREKLVKLRLGPFRIDPQRDREVCQAVKIPGITGQEIASWEARSRLSHGGATASHHLVLYGYAGTDSKDFPKGLVDDSAGCAGFGPPDFFKARVFLSGSGGETREGNWSVTTGSWPGDLAEVVPAPKDDAKDAWLVINSHYFNNSPKVGHGVVRLTMWLRPLDPRKRVIRQVIHGDASRYIMLPPNTETDRSANPVTSALRADGAVNTQTEGGHNPSGDVCVFALNTHMHKRGTRFLIQYSESGQTDTVLDWADWIHAGLALFPAMTPITAPADDRTAGLLRAYTAANGYPEIRYSCEYANGVGGRDEKFGCQETPGVVPGVEWDGVSDPSTTHPQPCGKGGVNCDGKPCVPANLVFGPLSDDDMCILGALIYDPLPGVPLDQGCQLRNLD